MPKIQALTDAMRDMASSIGQKTAAISGGQATVIQCMAGILVNLTTTPKIFTTVHKSKTSMNYQTISANLTAYQDFLTMAAETYECADEDLAKWDEASKAVTGKSFLGPKYTYNEDDYQDYVYKRDYGVNCYSFIDAVLQDQGRGSLPGINGARFVDRDPIEEGQCIISGGERLSADDIRNLFSNAQVGDVIQMRWWYRKKDGSEGVSNHTAIISQVTENGVQFLNSHMDGDNPIVKNSNYTWAELANRYSNVGNGGGASIYRF